MSTIRQAILIVIALSVLWVVDAGSAMMAVFAISLILSAVYIIEHIKEETMVEQKELVFHDTVPLAEEELPQAREKAGRQKDKILTIFRCNPTLWYTPYQIQDIYRIVYGETILITSVRRSITDLTHEGTGRIRKGSYSDQVREKWHTKNNRWRYNPDYSPTLNPQK